MTALDTPLGAMVADSPRVTAQRKLNDLVDNSPRIIAQRKQLADVSARRQTMPMQLQAAPVQRVVSDEDILALKAELGTRLGVATAKAKTGGALALETFINTAADAGQIDGVNKENALALLKMTWALSQVARYIIGCVSGKTSEDGQQILGAFMDVAQVGTGRQPWGGGNLAEYVSDPDYFVNMLESPVRFLNDRFAEMNDATRLAMVKSVQGWNHQKGTGQLAEDLFVTDYAPPAAVVRSDVVVTLEQLQAAYLDENYAKPKALPVQDAQIFGFDQKEWKVKAVTAENCTLEPVD